jgi:hypothetical protein
MALGAAGRFGVRCFLFAHRIAFERELERSRHATQAQFLKLLDERLVTSKKK